MADAYWYETTLLLPFDGSNGSTTFTNYSPIPVQLTAQGNAKISTADSKFGGACLALDGSNSWVQTTRYDGFILGPGDFTVEFWLKTSDNNAAVLSAFYGGSAGWQCMVTSAGKMQFFVTSAVLTGAVTVNDNAWHHIAFTRSSGTLRLFVDGVADGSVAGVANDFSSFGAFMAIGTQGGTRSATFDLNGFVDDVRLTRGVARYTANFTPPGALDLTPAPINPSAINPAIPLVQLGTPALSYKSITTSSVVFDAIHGGNGRVSGTTKVKGTPNVPVHRRVRLHRDVDGLMIREQWSNPVTGAYSFDNINTAYKYTVVTYDYEHNFRAVIADNLTPDLMP